MILFQCNNVVILSLIIFFLNCNQHVIDTKHFEIPQHRTRLSTSFSSYPSHAQAETSNRPIPFSPNSAISKIH
jgi:hypothetical protein